MNPIALANLLALLLPLGIQTYKQIQAAHAGAVKPIEEVLASADMDVDAFLAMAREEIAKLKPPPPA
jgi:hypothetical protein